MPVAVSSPRRKGPAISVRNALNSYLSPPTHKVMKIANALRIFCPVFLWWRDWPQARDDRSALEAVRRAHNLHLTPLLRALRPGDDDRIRSNG